MDPGLFLPYAKKQPLIFCLKTNSIALHHSSNPYYKVYGCLKAKILINIYNNMCLYWGFMAVCDTQPLACHGGVSCESEYAQLYKQKYLWNIHSSSLPM